MVSNDLSKHGYGNFPMQTSQVAVASFAFSHASRSGSSSFYSHEIVVTLRQTDGYSPPDKFRLGRIATNRKEALDYTDQL